MLEDRIKEVENTIERAKYTPRTWGGKREEYFELLWTKLQMVCDEEFKGASKERLVELHRLEHHYMGLMRAFKKAYPELILWLHAIDIDIDN